MSKRSDQLFAFLVEIAENIAQATETFQRELEQGGDFGALASRMKTYEDKGDELISKLISLLNNTYITPLEREDYVILARRSTTSSTASTPAACASRCTTLRVQRRR